MKRFTDAQVRRFPLYLAYFNELRAKGVKIVSSPKIAAKIGYSQEQVRKDLQVISATRGINKKGRNLDSLIADLEGILKVKHEILGVVIGVGNLGSALLNFDNYDASNLKLIAGFDKKINKEERLRDKPIYPLEELEIKFKELGATFAVITVPSKEAQETIDLAIKAGARGILNFAATKVKVPNGIALENADFIASCAIFSHKLSLLEEGVENE